MVEVCRKLGISEQTVYRWQKHFAGMGVATRGAEGTSTICGIEPLERGYEPLDGRLHSHGARITRMPSPGCLARASRQGRPGMRGRRADDLPASLRAIRRVSAHRIAFIVSRGLLCGERACCWYIVGSSVGRVIRRERASAGA